MLIYVEEFKIVQINNSYSFFHGTHYYIFMISNCCKIKIPVEYNYLLQE